MKLIPQSEIDKAAVEYSSEHGAADDGDYFTKEEFIEFAKIDFKAGVEFAESKFEDLAIEFANWINTSRQGFHSLYREKNSTEPIYWAEAFASGRIDYTSKELFQQFIKDRNEENRG